LSITQELYTPTDVVTVQTVYAPLTNVIY